MQTEWWTVFGGFNGRTTHDTEQEAMEEYERVRKDDWSSKGLCSVTHHHIIASDAGDPYVNPGNY